MTLFDFFQFITAHAGVAVLFWVAVPAVTFLVNLWSGTTAEEIWRWRYVYAVLVYTAAIPGVFAVTLNIYLFLFERQSIWTMNLALQVLPILTMVGTLMLIRQKIPFGYVPGFGKLSGFLTLIAALIGLMWFFDRLRLVAFTYVPFVYIVVGFVGVLVLIRFAWSKMF
ncbi:hypothetical protein F5984_19705 [Rudanella paleaurantiibacter]|uniref:Uncharacterized protein n=1 Tax=Rudanella paleaurantiibacter TaxID=2614655 RepID=A0A7J5TVM8_9BACT|nr:hypothetical protein [Rudanella paleaurantiibacter]KAB7727983.1 hypothetical protein F5984_19705 [Rudanella paleaurantiibacter]